MALSLKDLERYRPAPKRAVVGDKPAPVRIKPWQDIPLEPDGAAGSGVRDRESIRVQDKALRRDETQASEKPLLREEPSASRNTLVRDDDRGLRSDEARAGVDPPVSVESIRAVEGNVETVDGAPSSRLGDSAVGDGARRRDEAPDEIPALAQPMAPFAEMLSSPTMLGSRIDESPGDLAPPSTGDNLADNRGQQATLGGGGAEPSRRDHSREHQASSRLHATGDTRILNRGQSADVGVPAAAAEPAPTLESSGPTDTETASALTTSRLERSLDNRLKVLEQARTTATRSEVLSERRLSSSDATELFAPTRAPSIAEAQSEVAAKPSQRPVRPDDRDAARAQDGRGGQKGRLPTSKQQLLVLGHLIEMQDATGLGHTPLLKRSDISEALGVPQESAKKQLQRLLERGWIMRKEARGGRWTGGTIFEVPREVAKVYDASVRAQQSDRPTAVVDYPDPSSAHVGQLGHANHEGGFGGGVSRTSAATGPQDVQQVAKRLQAVSERLGLADLGVGANDLLGIWRSGSFKTEAHLLDSLEHIAFYLGTEQARGIKHPKAWLISQLMRGYYAPPAGFKSQQEMQQEAALRATEAKLTALRELERRRIEAEFEVWLHELPQSRWRELLQGTPWVNRRIVTDAIKNILRPIFTEAYEHGAPSGA